MNLQTPWHKWIAFGGEKYSLPFVRDEWASLEISGQATVWS